MPELPFKMQEQEQTNWCWAAVSVSVAQFYNDPNWTRQCALANAVLGDILGGADCCTDGGSEACNRPWDLQPALLKMDHLEDVVSGPLTFEGIEVEIQKQRPVGCCILMPGPWRHFIALIGCAQTDSGARSVTVADPNFLTGDTSTLAYDDLLTKYGSGGRWEKTYLTR